MYKVEFFPEVKQDIADLPLDVLAEVKAYLKKYEKNPYRYGQKLHDHKQTKLEGYYKTYVADATYRIVYSVQEDHVKIVSIVVIGKRDNHEVYNTAHRRICT